MPNLHNNNETKDKNPVHKTAVSTGRYLTGRMVVTPNTGQYLHICMRSFICSGRPNPHNGTLVLAVLPREADRQSEQDNRAQHASMPSKSRTRSHLPARQRCPLMPSGRRDTHAHPPHRGCHRRCMACHRWGGHRRSTVPAHAGPCCLPCSLPYSLSGSGSIANRPMIFSGVSSCSLPAGYAA